MASLYYEMVNGTHGCIVSQWEETSEFGIGIFLRTDQHFYNRLLNQYVNK